MLRLFSLLFAFSFHFCDAQTLTTLDSIRSFKGIGFGNTINIPDLKTTITQDGFYIVIDKKSVEKNYLHSKYLYFLEYHFDWVMLEMTKNKEFYSVMGCVRLNSDDSLSLNKGELPPTFLSLCKEAEKIFGSKIKSDVRKNDGIVGAHVMYTWEGKKTTLELSINYNGLIQDLNAFYFTITDIETDTKRKLNNIKY